MLPHLGIGLAVLASVKPPCKQLELSYSEGRLHIHPYVLRRQLFLSPAKQSNQQLVKPRKKGESDR